MESKPDSPGPKSEAQVKNNLVSLRAQFGESSPDSKHWIHPELTAYFRQKPPPWPWQLWNDKTGEWIVFDCIEDIEAATEIVFDAAQVSQPGLFDTTPEVDNGYYSQ